MQDPPPPVEAVRTAAQTAGWALPRLVAAVVAAEADQPEGLAAAHGEAGPGEEVADGIAARLARRIGPGAVGAAVGGLAVVMMPDPEGPGRRRALEAALGDELRRGRPGRDLARGRREPAPRRGRVPARHAGADRGTGDQAASSPRGQSTPSTPVQSRSRLVVADEYLPALLMAAAPAIAADLARTRLAPLDGLGEGPRERLVITLRAWLDRPGQVQAVAAALDVHPQTVRYRLKQLRELFGERLDDPEARFELSLALRAAENLRY